MNSSSNEAGIVNYSFRKKLKRVRMDNVAYIHNVALGLDIKNASQ